MIGWQGGDGRPHRPFSEVTRHQGGLRVLGTGWWESVVIWAMGEAKDQSIQEASSVITEPHHRPPLSGPHRASVPPPHHHTWALEISVVGPAQHRARTCYCPAGRRGTVQEDRTGNMTAAPVNVNETGKLLMWLKRCCWPSLVTPASPVILFLFKLNRVVVFFKRDYWSLVINSWTRNRI